MKSFILVSIFLCNIFFPQISCLTCFNCGYLELPNGKKEPVTEEFGKIPFCDDFTQNEENTIEAYAVRRMLSFGNLEYHLPKEIELTVI